MIDVEAIADEWLQPCGNCDAGFPTPCTCATGDPRPVILGLVQEIERLRKRMLELHVEVADLIVENHGLREGSRYS